MTSMELIRLLEKSGWVENRQSGSHKIFEKGDLSVSVPYHGNKEMKPGLLNSILKRAGIK